MSMNSRLIDLIRNAGSPSIAVVGDLILDSYIQGDTNRISPEAPIQVLDVIEEKKALGGAANVAANLNNLGVHVEMCGVVGDDHIGVQIKNMLEEKGIGTAAVITDEERPTTVKTRVIAQNQQLVRIDREVRDEINPRVIERFIETLHPIVERSQIVILSDYAKGVLSQETIHTIISGTDVEVLVDPKGRDFTRYRGCRLITPNRKEAEEFTNVTICGLSDLREAARILFERIGVKEVVITLGSEGIYYAKGLEEDHIVPAEARSVYDVTGAGDTVIALLAFSLASGIRLDDAVRIANAGAGVVVGRLGVAAPSRRDLIDIFSKGTTLYKDKILTRTQAADVAAGIRRQGHRLVFTNGCFDLLHSGHVSYFRSAKKQGDYLMVAVNDDTSVRRIKGARRPILDQEERMELLASLQVVDYVVSFEEDTPLEIIQTISPDLLVKGEDWRDKGVVGREWVESHGGEVRLIPLKKGYSTTGVIQRILERYKADES